MGPLVMTAQLILALSILVIVHEFGHFITARMFGMRVHKFFLFFDAWGLKLFSKKVGDTEYGVGWLPLGGYVKIAGMIDESMDKDAMKQEPKSWEYRSKPPWQRFIVIIAGVTMNVILGALIFSMVLYHFKKQYLPNEAVADGIYAYELARDIGLQSGDKITKINGKPFERFDDVTALKVWFGGLLTVDRDGEILEIQVPKTYYQKLASGGRGLFIGAELTSLVIDSVRPKTAADTVGLIKGELITSVNGESISSFGDFREKLIDLKGEEITLTLSNRNASRDVQINVSNGGLIGVNIENPYEYKNYTIQKSLKYGTHDAFQTVIYNAKGLGKIFSGEQKASESFHGPIGIAVFYGAHWSWARFWFLTGLLSMVLAFVNILPIPALDGGHAVFIIYEIVTRRAPSDKFMERAQIAGTVILIALMAYVIGNDVWKHILN